MLVRCHVLLRHFVGAALLFNVWVEAQLPMHWIDPPPAGFNYGTGFENNTLTVEGSHRVLTWTTDYPRARIMLCQEYQNGSPASINLTVPDTKDTQINWIVDSSEFDLTQSPVFYLALRGILDDGSLVAAADVRTDYFNITKAVVAVSSTTSLKSATSSSRGQTSSQLSSMALLTSTASSEPTQTVGPPSSQESKGVSTAAAVGLGIACTVIVVVSVTALLIWYRRRKNLYPSTKLPTLRLRPELDAVREPGMLEATQRPMEMAADRRHELEIGIRSFQELGHEPESRHSS